VQLGAASPNQAIAAPFDVPYYLGVNVNSSGELPRQLLSSVPYALRAFGVANGTISADAIATGAVTDEKITGPISADKLNLSSVQKKYGKLAIVAQSGGDYSDPVSAMNDVVSWCGDTPSLNNPCILKIMPGNYNLGSSSLVMQAYVDIEGSGENTTTISGSVADASYPTLNGLIQGAPNSEIRMLSITNTASGSNATGILNSSAPVKMKRLKITVTGGSSINTGILNQNSSSDMSDIVIDVSGGSITYGINNLSYSNATIKRSKIMVTGSTGGTHGIHNNQSDTTISESEITVFGGGDTGQTYGIKNLYSSPKLTNVTVTAVFGQVVTGIFSNNATPEINMTTVTASAAALSSIGIQNYATSTKMSDVHVTATDSQYCTGIDNIGPSTPTLKNASILVSGASTKGQGIANNSNASSIMTNLSISVTGAIGDQYGIANNTNAGEITIKEGIIKVNGGTNNYGISNNISSTLTEISGFKIESSGGTKAYGIHNTDSNVTVDRSSIFTKNSLNTYGIFNAAGNSSNSLYIDSSILSGGYAVYSEKVDFVIQIGASKVLGAVVPPNGTFTRCGATYNGSYTVLNELCN
jgi:hypothetical protein